MTVAQYSVVKGTKTMNPFFGLAGVFCIAFFLSGAAAFVGIIATIPEGSATDTNNTDAEVVMLETGTGKITDLGLTVPKYDIKNVKLDLTDTIVTFYSGGQFLTYDISNLQTKDNYVPSSYNPSSDPYKSNGHFLTIYSSFTNSIVVRETVPSSSGTPRIEKEVASPTPANGAKLMTSDGEDFYWVAEEDTGYGGSIIYKYDNEANTTSQVLKTKVDISDISASGGRLAYGFRYNGVSRIMMLQPDTGKTYTFCVDCSKPRMGGNTIAALGASEILVQNISSGERRDIPEDRQVFDINVDDDKVAWSWFEEVDPITVHTFATGKEYTYQPDHMVYTFAMSGNKILMLRSKALLPTGAILPSNSVIQAFGVSATCLFGTIMMVAMGAILDSHRRKEAYAEYVKDWNRYWQENYAQAYKAQSYDAGQYYGYGYYQYPTTPQNYWY